MQTAKQHDDLDHGIEQFARSLITAGGADPDTLVQPGSPVIFGTPQGQAVKVNPDTLTPLWRLYIGAARMGLEIAREQARKEALVPEPEYARPNGPTQNPQHDGMGGTDAAGGI